MPSNLYYIRSFLLRISAKCISLANCDTKDMFCHKRMRLNLEKTLKVFLAVVCIGFVISLIMAHWEIRALNERLDKQTQRRRDDYLPVEEERVRVVGGNSTGQRHVTFRKRKNMEACPPLFGRVMVFMIYNGPILKDHYGVAMNSVQCYLKTTNYTFKSIDIDTDRRVKENCGRYTELNFIKHCAVAEYLKDTDWMLVLDADTAVVNPNHCIEEYIDDRVDVVLYERFFNFEIAVGNYLIRNSEFGRNFALGLAEWQYRRPDLPFGNSENGVLHMLVMESVLNETARAEIDMCWQIWKLSKDYDTYMSFVNCAKIIMGANRLWPGKLKVLRRAHAFVRDGFLTADRFCEYDFMFHGWKMNEVNVSGWESPFSRVINPNECGNGFQGWPYRNGWKVPVSEVLTSIRNLEHNAFKDFPAAGRAIPWLTVSDISHCFPHCEPGLHTYHEAAAKP